MSVEQNLERNVDDVDDEKGELVRHTSIQEEFAISFTRSPMQFVNVVFSYLLWLAPCFWKNRLTSQNVSIGNVNVFGSDSDDVQLCVNILHQILGSLSRCKVMTSICTASSGNRMRGTTHAGGGLVRRSGSVQHGPRVCLQSYWKSLCTAKATRS